MTDFLSWPIMDFVVVMNSVLLMWLIKEMIKIRSDLASLKGAYELAQKLILAVKTGA